MKKSKLTIVLLFQKKQAKIISLIEEAYQNTNILIFSKINDFIEYLAHHKVDIIITGFYKKEELNYKEILKIHKPTIFCSNKKNRTTGYSDHS